jgi:hypothetical protein
VAGFDRLEAAAGNAENPPRRHYPFAYLRLKPFGTRRSAARLKQNCMSAQLRQEEREEVGLNNAIALQD